MAALPFDPKYDDAQRYYALRLCHPSFVTPANPANTGGTFVTEIFRFHNDLCAVVWYSDTPSVVLHTSLDNVKKIHCALGETILIPAASRDAAIEQVRAGLWDAQIDALPPPRRALAIENLVRTGLRAAP
jgi:hypothetical protein